jgi:Fe-S cluster biogenesis protein NfuA
MDPMAAEPLAQFVKRALGVLSLYDLDARATYRTDAAPLRPAPVPLSAANPPPAEVAPVEIARQFLGGVNGRPLTVQNVEEALDDLVRPALNADGGDIALVKIEDNDIYVRLVGACASCPSSIMTMRMGVERLLQDEFPDMGELISVDA